MLPVVYVPQPVHPDALTRLREHARVEVGFGPGARPLAEVAGQVRGVLTRTRPVDAADIAAMPELAVIARHGVGVDSIDVAAATERGVPVCITPDANMVAVAEHVFALLLAVARNVVTGDHRVRTGGFADRDALTGVELRGARLGVIGYGRIGAEVARIARDGFRMEVAGHDPFLGAAAVRARGAEPAGLDELLSTCAAVTVHVPLTERTRGLIGARELDLMPAGAVLVHTARGGIVDEAALAERLRTGRLRGAGVDVFTAEPPPADNPLLSAGGAVLTPHLAGQTHGSMRRMAMGAADAVITVLRGGRPPAAAVVNPQAWERAAG
ncbi:hydroxyacid dehydrogenase [Allonocardiopsis opalescens]|uniref:D-3-phosphoglycerate dehydrogenase n=1 Tax=Allonocardiopsis opalescens TaxID=1144618 RepID=A0A2T0Q2Z2_9ACTN|nr:hydroxyacid dehydrogenase [Allonocardiopsis opalescens]PRX98038.1 D-3-phosphoglycerate dehydrogenase [Allonocardiopsis opalescens]